MKYGVTGLKDAEVIEGYEPWPCEGDRHFKVVYIDKHEEKWSILEKRKLDKIMLEQLKIFVKEHPSNGMIGKIVRVMEKANIKAVCVFIAAKGGIDSLLGNFKGGMITIGLSGLILGSYIACMKMGQKVIGCSTNNLRDYDKYKYYLGHYDEFKDIPCSIQRDLEGPTIGLEYGIDYDLVANTTFVGPNDVDRYQLKHLKFLHVLSKEMKNYDRY